MVLACSGEEDSSEPRGEGDGDAGEGDGDGGDGDGDAGNGDGDGDAGDGDGDGESGDGDGDGDGPLTRVICDGVDLCGSDGNIDCCTRVAIPGGTFLMGRGESTDACPGGETCPPHEAPEHAVLVDSFALDAFEVTVGRFRRFVETYDEFSIGEGDGAHPLISGSGWQSAFASGLPESAALLRASLVCDDEATWTDEVGESEALPINCVSWATAFAFCAAAGGRLPTEAEWEYAAAGGDENRLYPWGSMAPTAERASYFPGALTDAGLLDAGDGRYANADLAGNVWEWALDWLDTGWYDGAGADCDNCARVTTGTHRVIRGGAFSYQETTLRAATRSGELPEALDAALGFRCAYSVD